MNTNHEIYTNKEGRINRKIFIILCLFIIFIFQLSFPLLNIKNRIDLLNNGTEYKILISSIEIVDDDELILYYSNFNIGDIDINSKYLCFDEKENGIYEFSHVTSRLPNTDKYIKIKQNFSLKLPIEVYKNKNAKELFDMILNYKSQGKYFCALVKTYNGDAILLDIILENGMSLNDLI